MSTIIHEQTYGGGAAPAVCIRITLGRVHGCVTLIDVDVIRCTYYVSHANARNFAERLSAGEEPDAVLPDVQRIAAAIAKKANAQSMTRQRGRDEAMRSVGLTKVRSASGKVYWE
jgi:hypothetical protein